MGVIRDDKMAHIVYEYETGGILVAISKENQKEIKKFWKKYKGKRDIPNNTVKGHPFEQDEEQESLKINFDIENDYPISELKKFD